MTATIAGSDSGDNIDNVHTVADLTKYRVTKVSAAMVEEVVIVQVDEELRRSAVDSTGSSHCKRTALILLAVVRFVLDRVTRWLGIHIFIHAAALNHEVWDHAVKNGAIEVSVCNVLTEVLAG